MRKERKILSVIVSAYNMEHLLPKCLNSVIIKDRHLLSLLEVIVVNDGSKDRTSEIAHGFQSRYPDVFNVIDKRNGHYGSCVNVALEIAVGEYIRTLDADDSVDTDAFEKFLKIVEEEYLKEDEGADLIITDHLRVDSDGKVLGRSRFGLDEQMKTLSEIPEDGDRLCNPSITYRTSRIRKIGYRQSEGMAYTDSEWLCEPMVAVRRIRYVPLTVILYLIGRDGQTMNPEVLSRGFQSILTITQGIVSRYGKNMSIGEQSSLGYYKRQVVSMLRICYNWGILGFNGYKMMGDLRGFDESIKPYSVLYREMGELKNGPNHFPFHYVEFWRKHGLGLVWRLRYVLNDFLLWFAGKTRYYKWQGLLSK